MALTFRQLRYFLVLSEELHFGKAAQRLYISQPPLSASLRQLEEELKVKLLLRNSKRVTLTPAGEAFQRQARRILEQLEDSQTLVQRITGLPGLPDGLAGGACAAQAHFPPPMTKYGSWFVRHSQLQLSRVMREGFVTGNFCTSHNDALLALPLAGLG